MIKVLHIITDTNIGGAGIWVLNTVGSMDQDYAMYVALPKGSLLIKRLEKVLPKAHVIEVDGIADRSISYQGILALRKVIKRIRPNVVHAHASLSGRIAAKSIRGIAIINSRHCIEPISKGIRGEIKKTVNNFFSDKIVAVSQGIYDNLIESGVPKHKAIQLSNGVAPIKVIPEEALDKQRQEYNLDKDVCVIGFIGRLEPVKGVVHIPRILDALRGITDQPFRCLIAGDGGQKRELLEAIREKNLDAHVQYLGLIDEIESFYGMTDILINTSESEGIPMSLIEGMSVALPIVAFDVGSLDQLVYNGENGHRIEPYDIEGFARTLKMLIENREKRMAYGNRSKEIMESHFHINQMVKELATLYREVLI